MTQSESVARPAPDAVTEELCELVRRGFSVERHLSHRNQLDVYLPEDLVRERPEVRAMIVLNDVPHEKGLHGGRIRRLLITLKRSPILLSKIGLTMDKQRALLFDFQEEVRWDDLAGDQDARMLFDAVIEMLNHTPAH